MPIYWASVVNLGKGGALKGSDRPTRPGSDKSGGLFGVVGKEGRADNCSMVRSEAEGDEEFYLTYCRFVDSANLSGSMKSDVKFWRLRLEKQKPELADFWQDRRT
ncbi:MAG: hypothetical protein P1U53_09325 [Sulfitobacter sp.]|nr:hypothetical protein [Sulfitobacter sp.]